MIAKPPKTSNLPRTPKPAAPPTSSVDLIAKLDTLELDPNDEIVQSKLYDAPLFILANVERLVAGTPHSSSVERALDVAVALGLERLNESPAKQGWSLLLGAVKDKEQTWPDASDWTDIVAFTKGFSFVVPDLQAGRRNRGYRLRDSTRKTAAAIGELLGLSSSTVSQLAIIDVLTEQPDAILRPEMRAIVADFESKLSKRVRVLTAWLGALDLPLSTPMARALEVLNVR